MKKDNLIKSVLAALFSAITIGALTYLTYKTTFGLFLIAISRALSKLLGKFILFIFIYFLLYRRKDTTEYICFHVIYVGSLKKTPHSSK